MVSLLLVLNLLAVGFQESSSACDLEIVLSGREFENPTTVSVALKSRSLRKIFVEDGLRVQELVRDRWVGPRLENGEVRSIGVHDLNDPDELVAEYWLDVAKPRDGIRSLFIEPGEYRFYVKYYLYRPRFRGSEVSCVSKSESFKIMQSSGIAPLR